MKAIRCWCGNLEACRMMWSEDSGSASGNRRSVSHAANTGRIMMEAMSVTPRADNSELSEPAL